MMTKIVPHLWYDKEAKEAAEFYVRLFEESRFLDSTILEDTPSGDAEAVRFILAGQPFEAISAGPVFKLNPSISLTVNCASAEEVDRLWSALSRGGTALMPLGEYPFSPHYGWIQDRFGLSWQLMLTEGGVPTQKIIPSLLFSGDACGKAEKALEFYEAVFPGSKIGLVSRYGDGEAEVPDAKINYAAFSLFGQNFTAMDHGYGGDFTFNEAFSLILYCEDQKEIDKYWQKLSHVPEAEACGWLKDRFGVSWQIVPREMTDMMADGSREQVQRVMAAFMPMKKLDIEALRRAFEGR